MSDKSYPFTGKVLWKDPDRKQLVAHFTDFSAQLGDTHAVIPQNILAQNPDICVGAAVTGYFEVVDDQSQVVHIDTISP